MSKKLYTVIVGTGSYVPPTVIPNSYFLDAEFYDPSTGKKFETSNEEIIRKFVSIVDAKSKLSDPVAQHDQSAVF